MTLTVRLPPRVEQDLAEYCVKHRLTKSEAVKLALEHLLRPRAASESSAAPHAFVGCDDRSGDVARHVKRLLRERLHAKRARG